MAPKILVAILDWGLGHATRCIPLIHTLLAQGATVIPASNGRARALLQAEFPHLTIEQLPAYRIRYAYKNMYFNIGVQMPGIAATIRQEYQALKKLIAQHQINGVISDNRFGCYSPYVPCVFITHQVQIQVPNARLQQIVNTANHHYIHHFSACWIPDLPGEASLSGSLSEHGRLRIPVRHLGVLSRMQPMEVPAVHDCAIVLSGPEPQRSRLEDMLIAQAKTLPQRSLVVQGQTEAYRHWQAADNVEIISFLTGAALNRAMAAARSIVCRSGYSSIMDLAMLGKKAILIPTPGQTEQHYLAQRFHEQRIFYRQWQHQLDLGQALSEHLTFAGLDPVLYQESQHRLTQVVQDFLRSL
ncbi:MAG TPA: glycosyltransferase [Saprospiraceae bacterium]|nr:glycosyltransferase [Saprospiraceae bacterium]HMP25252.1 glycosyltransferase [Saprospiraceae bacterium]